MNYLYIDTRYQYNGHFKMYHHQKHLWKTIEYGIVLTVTIIIWCILALPMLFYLIQSSEVSHIMSLMCTVVWIAIYIYSYRNNVLLIITCLGTKHFTF